jgi:hypothetical protein
MPCTRHGHAVAERAKHGHYAPVKAWKYCDGKAHTYLDREGFEAFEAQRQEARKLEFLVVSPKGTVVSPTVSEDEMYGLFSGMEVTESNVAKGTKVEEKKPASTPGPRGFFKEASSPIRKPKKDVDKVKTEKGGLGGSPSAKILQEAGVLEEEIPQSTLALMGMMDKMTEVLNKLADRDVPPAAPSGRSVSPGEVRPQPAPRTAKKETAAETPKERWYAVGRGKGGRSGVFQSWGEAAPLVNGDAGAVYKRFGDFNAALDFLQRYEDTATKLKVAPGEDSLSSDFWYAVMNAGLNFYRVYSSWPEAMPHVTGVKGATCKKYRSYDDAIDHLEASKIEVGK